MTGVPQVGSLEGAEADEYNAMLKLVSDLRTRHDLNHWQVALELTMLWNAGVRYADLMHACASLDRPRRHVADPWGYVRAVAFSDAAHRIGSAAQLGTYPWPYLYPTPPAVTVGGAS